MYTKYHQNTTDNNKLASVLTRKLNNTINQNHFVYFMFNSKEKQNSLLYC